MPEGKRKSRSQRKVARRSPKGNVRIHYKKTKPSKAKCASCGAVLMGVPRERPFKMSKTGKAKKKPQRPYGGNLCSKCTRKKVLEKTVIGV